MNNEYINQGLGDIKDQLDYFKAYNLFMSTNPSEDQRIDFLSGLYNEFLTRNRLPVMSADELQYEIIERFQSDTDDDLSHFLGFEITKDEKNQICGWLDKFMKVWEQEITIEIDPITGDATNPVNHTIDSQVCYYENHALATYREMMMLTKVQFANWVCDVLIKDYAVNIDDAVQIIKNFIKFKNEVK